MCLCVYVCVCVFWSFWWLWVWFIGKKMLVPLTASLYVPGTLDDADKVLVDVGTGYFIEVSEFFLSKLCIWCSVIQFWGVCSMYGEFMFYVWFWLDLIDRFWMLFSLGIILVCYTIPDHQSCLACDATLCFSCISFDWRWIWVQREFILFHLVGMHIPLSDGYFFRFFFVWLYLVYRSWL